jgi:hypothetical protein
MQIPAPAQTLDILSLMGEHAPILMLRGDADGYGTRWTLHGQEVQPAIAQFLMQSHYLIDAGPTEMGARMLVLSEAGIEFRAAGQRWWNGLGIFEKLKVRLLG